MKPLCKVRNLLAHWIAATFGHAIYIVAIKTSSKCLPKIEVEGASNALNFKLIDYSERPFSSEIALLANLSP